MAQAPSAAPILIVENSITFYSAWKASQARPHRPAVVYGRGKMLKSRELATASLEGLCREVAEQLGSAALPALQYFGDLDTEGVEIPLAINSHRVEAGLEPLCPATALYRADRIPEATGRVRLACIAAA